MPGTVAQCTGPLGNLTPIRETIDLHIPGRLLGRTIINPPGTQVFDGELLPSVTTAELLHDVPPLISTAA